jgi:HKD family nuclease
MKTKIPLRPYRSIVGHPSDQAVVISLPQKFDLNRALKQADEILLATAFARMTGWNHLKSSVLETAAQMRLLTGLDFMQTEPKLLREWLRLAGRNAGIQAKLASSGSTFHPKVLIVKARDPHSNFAIVGSGNLTHGGFCTNTECSIYTDHPATLAILTEWFDRCWRNGTELKKTAIDVYSPKFKKAQKAAKTIRKEQRQVERAIVKIAQAEAVSSAANQQVFTKAIDAFKRYRKEPAFKRGYEMRLNAAQTIRRLLHIPKFNFDRHEFNEFYKIKHLGTLRQRWRDNIFSQRKQLKRALSILVDENIPIEKRVDSVLDGPAAIRGLGRGGASKILASANPSKWPVLNGPVETVLKSYGYKTRRGFSIGQKYRAFSSFMNMFKAKAKAPDFIALDAFFKSTEKQKRKRAARVL